VRFANEPRQNPGRYVPVKSTNGDRLNPLEFNPMTELLALARTWNETIKTVEDSGIFDDLDASEIQALDNLRTAIAACLEEANIETDLIEIY
jgi:dsDNA-specific endonuclease/ATPase MutS2